MSHLAQSRDLSDPKLILDFARNVGDRANLRDLYLLTFADIRASSATAWTDWKGQLLRELFERTSELLERGSTDSDTAIELIARRVETRRTGATTELVSLGIPEQTVIAYFEMMPRRYFTAHTPRQIARHAQVVLGYEPEQGIATAVRDMRAFSEFILCTADRRGLHAEVSGTLTAHHLNILGAHVYTTRSGLALEIYRLSTPPGGEEERRFKWRELEASLTRVLSGEIDVDELLRSRGRPLGSEAAPSHQPASVNISNDESDFYTIVDVTADDRLGLLHDLTGVIAQHGYEIYISKAATVLDQVTDTFYLKDRDRKKLSDGAAVEGLKRDLYDAARRGGEAGGP
jgi:[protein-PII] uridylyltransferase